MRRLVLGLSFFLFPVFALSQSSVIRRMEGWYIVPSKYCSVLEDGVLTPCGPDTNDTLSIERIDDSHARVELYSLQTNGHVCELSGIADRVGDKLVYTEKGEMGHGDQVEIAIVGSLIKLNVLTDDGTMRSPFCGMRATLDRLEFPLNEGKHEANHMDTEADGKPHCADSPIEFDGAAAKIRETVTVQPGERAYLHRKYPLECDHRGGPSCQAKAYLVNGDTVAVGESCGNWTRVQFVGAKTSSVGWISSGQLGPLAVGPASAPENISSSGIQGVWQDRSGEFSLIVRVMGPVICGYLDDTDASGKGNDSFIVGRLGKSATIVEYDSTWGNGRGRASLSLIGDRLKWHVLNDIVGDKTPDNDVLDRAPASNLYDPDTEQKCEEWRPLIEVGKTAVLDLRELGSYKK